MPRERKNQGRKELYRVNIYDRDGRREMDIETHAYSKGTAENNAWFRLMKILDIRLPVGIFRKRYGEQYRITATLVDGPEQEEWLDENG